MLHFYQYKFEEYKISNTVHSRHSTAKKNAHPPVYYPATSTTRDCRRHSPPTSHFVSTERALERESVQWRLLQILLTSPNSENLQRRKSNTINLPICLFTNNNIKFSPSSDHYKFIPPMFSTNISTPPS